MRISDWSSDVCSSDLHRGGVQRGMCPRCLFLDRSLVDVADRALETRVGQAGAGQRGPRRDDDLTTTVDVDMAAQPADGFEVLSAGQSPALQQIGCFPPWPVESQDERRCRTDGV